MEREAALRQELEDTTRSGERPGSPGIRTRTSDEPLAELPDGDVVARVLDGDTAHFAVLVKRYGDVIYRHAERMVGRPDEAADLVQATFVRGFRDLRRCRQPDRVGGWLFRIAANLCKDHLKSRRRRDVRIEDVEVVADQTDPARGAELRGAIRSALDRLTPEQREAFLLKHEEGYSYEEMAELLGQPVPALKMRVHRARAELQSLLEKYR